MHNLPSPVALIGSSGFVGGTLDRQFSFDLKYRRSNVEELVADRPATVVCAGAPAAKWQANQEPEADLENLYRLMKVLSAGSIERLILISTVDIYPSPTDVDELTPIAPAANHAYGRNRYYLEMFARETCDDTTIVRLPALFGTGLKKNFIFDLLHQRDEQFTHRDSSFQFYDLSRLWQDIETAIEARISLVNFATEPVAARKVASHVFGVDYTYETAAAPVRYDIRTVHSSAYGRDDGYIRSADEVISDLQAFVAGER